MGKIKEITEGWKNLIFKKEEIEIIAKKRSDVCNRCTHHSKFHKSSRPDAHCTKCGCTISAKTRSLTSSCPIGLWKTVKKE